MAKTFLEKRIEANIIKTKHMNNKKYMLEIKGENDREGGKLYISRRYNNIRKYDEKNK